MLTLRGLRPAAMAPGLANLFYFLDRDFRFTGESHAPLAPNGGGTHRKGVNDW
jgi:hypothetical protein